MLIPVMFSFFAMGFVDLVGIATNYVKADFQLSDTLANLLPSMVFFWFLVFSVPTGIMMNKIGQRKTVLLSLAVTFIALLLPLISYSFAMMMISFSFLGIGNTLMQVSLNPLLSNIVSGERLASSLTLGQFIKAISSLLGPVIAGAVAALWGDWKWIFAVYAVTTLLSLLWLLLVVPADSKPDTQRTGFRTVCSLFRDRYILMLFLGILFIVGVDVGLNTTIPKLLMEKLDMPLDDAGLGTSLYFLARTVGSFIGAFVLARVASDRFLLYSMIVSVVAFIALLSLDSLWPMAAMIVIVGLACANVFSILFAFALQHMPERDNEISALMIMGVSGGALITPAMGVLADAFGQVAALSLLLVCMAYLGVIALKVKNH